MSEVFCLYGLPLLVVNAWLVMYTWLHHTDTDIPHLDSTAWTWIKGAFLTVDRPYPWIVDYLHHHIGTSHVAHHIFPRMPHYHGPDVTRILAREYPSLYRFDPTPIPEALWRVCTECITASPVGNGNYRYINGWIGNKKVI